MSKRNSELIRRKTPLNEDAESVVQRYPRRQSPWLPIFIVVIVFIFFIFRPGFDSVDPDLATATRINQVAKPADRTERPTVKPGIHDLVSKAHVKALRLRLAATTDKTAVNALVGGMTPLMLAASQGNVEILDLLLSHGADANARGSMQRTALQYATEKNRVEAAKRLLAEGAELDAYDNGRLTPLIMAANRGYTDLALFYISKGANLDIQHNEGWTALIDAVVANDTRLVTALLAAGADRQLATKNGMKAIDYARQYEFKNIEQLLREPGRPLTQK